jgi:hypothetical protein
MPSRLALASNARSHIDRDPSAPTSGAPIESCRSPLTSDNPASRNQFHRPPNEVCSVSKADPPTDVADWSVHDLERTSTCLSNLRCNNRLSPYSITSSARASSVAGTSRPSAFAAVKLITSSNFVGNSIGKSPGLAPLSILSTKAAVRRQLSRKSIP